jgi:hypothetical protein
MGMGTIIVSHVAFSMPFVLLVVRARLHGFDNRLEEAAMDLGANEWTTFWKVTLPLIAPGVLAGAMLAFTLSLDDFIITFFHQRPWRHNAADLRLRFAAPRRHAGGQRPVDDLDSGVLVWWGFLNGYQNREHRVCERMEMMTLKTSWKTVRRCW